MIQSLSAHQVSEDAQQAEQQKNTLALIEIGREAVGLFEELFTKKWASMPAEIRSLFPQDAVSLAFGADGRILPDSMIRIVRPMSKAEIEEGKALTENWKYERDVENLVFDGPYHIKFIRVSASKDAGDYIQSVPIKHFRSMLNDWLA